MWYIPRTPWVPKFGEVTTTVAPRSTVLNAAPASATAGTRAGASAPGPVLRLRLQAGAGLLLIAVLLVAALISFSTARTDLHRLTTVSEPRAAAAADLYQSLADLDAQHAKSLVVGYSSQPPAAGQPLVLVDDGVLAALTAQADHRRIAQDLTALAGSSASSADPGVRALLDALGSYDGLTGTESFSTFSQSAPVVGRPPDLALDYYGQAEGLLQQSLLPRVRTLLAAADAQVSADRAGAVADGHRGALLLAATGAAALLLLGYWQLDLTRRHRRLFNPALLLATGAVLAVALGGGPALLNSADQVDAAVREGYTPYAAVAQAQVAAADAEAVQSRWLVDDAYRSSLQGQFGQLTTRLGALTAGPAGTAGTAAVTRTQRDYLASDARLRELAGQGRLDDAAVQLTGVTRGQVAFAYYDLSGRLQDLADARAARFDAGVAAAGDELSGWTVIPSGLLGAALLLVLVGVRPRLAEFA